MIVTGIFTGANITPKIKKERVRVIKILAALFMLIDHIRMIFFPENYLLRIIGCVSMPLFAFVGMTVLYSLYVLTGGSPIQAFSIVAFPILIIAKRHDNKLSLPRRFFYWFYPLHIGVLLLLKGVILSC